MLTSACIVGIGRACCPFVIVLFGSVPTFGAALLVSVNPGAYQKSPATPLGSYATCGQRPLFFLWQGNGVRRANLSAFRLRKHRK